MKSFLMLGGAAALCLAALSAAPAHAQNQRSWVASFGDDANPCTRDTPCRTFHGALAETNINGEINCVDAADFAGVFALVITKSVTIDCAKRAFVGASCLCTGRSIRAGVQRFGLRFSGTAMVVGPWPGKPSKQSRPRSSTVSLFGKPIRF